MKKNLSISREDVEKTLKNKDIVLSDYKLQERLLEETFKKYHKNTNYDQVYLKVAMLNAFYSTGIQDVASVAKKIVDQKDVIDKLMAKGNPTVVHRIALVKHGKRNPINHFSFATKYCSFHYPELYPIFDSLVYSVLYKFRDVGSTGLFSKSAIMDKKWTPKKGARCGYALYKKIYDHFIELYATNFNEKDYKTIDRYLWGSRKIAGLAKNDRHIKENRAAFNTIKINDLNKSMTTKKKK
jgi:hypothetical protein